MIKNISKIFFLILFLNTVNVSAIDEFVIEDIRVAGLQRLTPGTIFNYLPVEIGDVFNDQTASESLRELFRTGFFDDVTIEKE